MEGDGLRIIARSMLILAAALLPSGAGAATLSKCILESFTPHADKVIVEEYLAMGPNALPKASLPDAVTVADSCLPRNKGRAPEDILRITSTLAGHWMKVGAQAALVQRHKLTAKQLDSAWNNLAAAQRNRFSRAGKSDVQSTDAQIAFIHSVRPDLSIAKLNELRHGEPEPSAEMKPYASLIIDLTAYAIGRGMQESPELIDVSLPDSSLH